MVRVQYLYLWYEEEILCCIDRLLEIQEGHTFVQLNTILVHQQKVHDVYKQKRSNGARIGDNAPPENGVMPTPHGKQTVLQHYIRKDVYDVDTY